MLGNTSSPPITYTYLYKHIKKNLDLQLLTFIIEVKRIKNNIVILQINNVSN